MRHYFYESSPPQWDGRKFFGSRHRLREQLRTGSVALALMAASQAPNLANAQAPSQPSAPAMKDSAVTQILPEIDPVADAEQIAASAEAVLKEQDQLRKDELAQELIRDAGALPPGEAKTSLLKRLARIFASDSAGTTNARKAALTIDPAAAAEQARTLVLLAKAELASGQGQQAWWTLHEAQQIALKLQDETEIVAVFREIGLVEQSLTKAANPDFNYAPKAGEVVATVLENGLPPKGYQELDIVREGGGPLREPTVIQHTYYYNGDRVFQGPKFKGGPTIVQVTHPKSGCQVCVRVNMPTGAPLIEYDDSFIRYYFPDVHVELRFRRSGCCEVDYHHCCNPYDRLRNKIESKELRKPEKSEPGGAANAIGSLLSVGAGGPLSLASRLPGTSDLLQSKESRIPNTLRQSSKVKRSLPGDLRR